MQSGCCVDLDAREGEVVGVVVDIQHIGRTELTVEDEILEDPVGVIDLEHLAGVGDDDGAWLSGGDRDGRVLLAAALCRQVFIIGAGRDDDPVSRLCLVQHRLDGFTGFDVKLGTVCAQDQR